jgi:hypothetical protein
MRPPKQLWRFQWDHGSRFGGFNETAEAASAVSMTLRNPFKKILTTLFSHRKVVFSTKLCKTKFGFRGLNETAEADSAVSMRPRKQIQQSQWGRRSGFSGFNETANGDSAVSMRPRNPFWHRGSPCKNKYWLSIPLKGFYRKNKYILKHYIIIVTRKRKC